MIESKLQALYCEIIIIIILTWSYLDQGKGVEFNDLVNNGLSVDNPLRLPLRDVLFQFVRLFGPQRRSVVEANALLPVNEGGSFVLFQDLRIIGSELLLWCRLMSITV